MYFAMSCLTPRAHESHRVQIETAADASAATFERDIPSSRTFFRARPVPELDQLHVRKRGLIDRRLAASGRDERDELRFRREPPATRRLAHGIRPAHLADHAD